MIAAKPAWAAADQVQKGPVPAWVVPSELMPVPDEASGLLFVRRQDNLVHFDKRGEAYHFGYRIKILHPNALELGNLSISWNPSAGPPIVHAIKVHRGGQTIDVLKSASFEILRREDQLEEASLNGVLTAILRIADLRVGDELEVSFTTRANDPTLGTNDAGLLTLPANPAPGRFRLGLSWDEGQEPRVQLTPDMAAVARREPRAVTFDFDNPASVTHPNGAPARFGWQRIVEYSDFPGWETISRHFAPLYAKAAKFDSRSPLKEEARRIAAAHSSSLERASAALKLVQQEVRYIYVGLAGGNLTPADADVTWQRRFGDCKGKTALLLALLTELGIQAEPVLVRNAGGDDGLDARLPSTRMFDHVLVRARIDGSDYWLDGTLPPVAAPSRDPVIPYRWILPIKSEGRSVEPLKWRAPQRPDEVSLFEIDATAGFDQAARITNTMIVRGLKGLQQQVQFSGLTAQQLLDSARQHMIGDTWQTIESARWRYDAKAQASILTISGMGAVDWDDDGEGAKSIALPGGGFNPPERRVRPADQDQDAPYGNMPEFSCHVTTVRFPKSTQASGWSVNSNYDTRLFGRNYYRAFELRGGTARMVRGSRVEKQEIDAATAKRDNQRIGAFDNSMARLSYDPAGGPPNAEGHGTVPATDEIDWTADQVPCLSRTAAD